jgi:class 3 adenylate cyclase/tetratricopeptide (TPR) repeat protein
VVHRDLKPSNIMIDQEGNAFVADFGIARISDAKEDLTGTGVTIGTPGYMAPEQILVDQDVGQRADVYALGVIAFEMLAGQQPYNGGNPVEALMAHLNEPVPAIRELNPDLPPDVDTVIRTALAKEAEERYPSAGALITDLGGALHVEVSNIPSQLQSMTQAIAAEQIARQAEADDELGSTGTPSEQQRQLTAVYLDLAELAEILYEKFEEPATVSRHMDPLWEGFGKTAEEFGGVIQSRTGEVGIALWGAETTREDDPEQAIRATLEMRASVGKVAQELWGEGWQPTADGFSADGFSAAEPLPMTAGITTGRVLLVRDDETSSYTASGAAINLAGRLKDAAPAGEILVTHETFTHVRGVFDFFAQTPIRIRGRKELLDVYSVLRARPRAFHMHVRGIEGVETRMIGREIELRILQEALSLTIEDGETQVVTVVGEAGVGKSRLLYELTNWVDLLEERLWFFEARATQPSMLQPFSLTRDLFSFRFQILDNDPPLVVREKFQEGVAGFLGPDCDEKAQLIGQLVGFDFTDSPAVQAALHDPESFQRVALEHLGELFTTAAATQPVFIQVEDIHWADDRSLDLLNNLVRENTEIPLFIICMARPGLFERRPSWGEGQEFHARIALEPLSRLSSRRLVRELLKKVETVPTRLRDLIIDRAEGNPFYMEELIKTMIDDGVVVKGKDDWQVEMDKLATIRVPPTLTGVLQARQDTLPPGQRALLLRASVIGRIFWESAVAHLSATDRVTAGSVGSMLEELRQREMVFKREDSAFAGTGEYVFRHAILRDVTYESNVPRQRRAYHKLMAEWLLAVSGDRQDEYQLLVAEHYEAAGEMALAAQFLSDAAAAARTLGAFEEGIAALKSALALLEGDEHAAQRIAIKVQLGDVYATKGAYDEALAQLEPALESARELGDRAVEANTLAQLGRVSGLYQGNTELGQRYLVRALEIARELDDRPVLVFVLRILGWLSAYVRGMQAEAQAYFEESLDLARELDDRGAESASLNGLASIFGPDELEEAMGYFEKSLAIAREIGDRNGAAIVVNNIGNLYLIRGDYAEARPYFEESLVIAREIRSEGGISTALLNLGTIAAWEGDGEQARVYLNQATEIFMRVGSLHVVLIALADYALLRKQAGDPVRGLEWMGLVYAHPLFEKTIGDEIEPMMAEVRAGIADEEVEAAMARGAELNLEEIIAEILAETE